jgi:hypothetical protein
MIRGMLRRAALGTRLDDGQGGAEALAADALGVDHPSDSASKISPAGSCHGDGTQARTPRKPSSSFLDRC